MSELYHVKDFEDLQEGEPVLAFGVHCTRWDFEQLGNPAYGIVPATAEQTELETLRSALEGLMKFHPEDECGPTTEEYWTPEYRAAMDAARAALEGGEK